MKSGVGLSRSWIEWLVEPTDDQWMLPSDAWQGCHVENGTINSKF
jgi:hypothetical protein